jgi:DNA-binding CsgD family transcriptional regulator
MSGTLVIRGEAGIGKTSMLNYAVNAAHGFNKLRADGVESEKDISFAAIHRLLVPLLPATEDLPEPQRLALEATFGRHQHAPPDRFLVGLAALTLLSRTAERQPRLCVIDDAHWIDGESLDLLAFVARRLYAESVVIMFTVRDPVDGRDPLFGLPDLKMAGLEETDARQLLASAVVGSLDATTEGRILADTEGNPLALIELGQDAAMGGPTSGLLPDEPVPLGSRLETLFRRHLQSLPEPTQEFLLIAAAEPRSLALVSQASQKLGLPFDAAEPAIEAGLLDGRNLPAFRHPLIRSAVYGSATAAERRRTHTVLAELADPAGDNSRAWHLAAAAEGPDEKVAAELEASAAKAHSRGGWAARAAMLDRAANLTPEGPRKVDRLLTAAEAAVVAANPVRARSLLRQALTSTTDQARIANGRRVEAGLQSFTWPGRVPAMLLEAATALEPIDTKQARETYAEALQACLVSCQLTFDTTPAAVGAAALAAFSREAEPDIVDVMVEGFATRFGVGYIDAVPVLRRAIELLCTNSTPPVGLTRWSIFGNNASADLWDSEGFRRLTTQLEQAERERGALDSLVVTLGGMGHWLMWSGDFAAAESAHTEATGIFVSLGGDAANYEALKVELFAWQGRDADTRFVAELLTGDFTQRAGAGVAVNLARVALVVLDVAQGRYSDALATGQQLAVDDPCPQGSQVLPWLIEAATRTGDIDSAESALERLRERANASGTPWALGLLEVSEALTNTADPERHYIRAIELLESTYVKTDLARAHLLFGEWLRRKKRRHDARSQLRAAFQLFDMMGAMAYAERARIELAATGERARRRTVDTSSELTPQEHQIAILVAAGATNQEIAAKLFLSAGTVDYHLRKIFRKLGVSSRRHVDAALGTYRAGGVDII